LLEGTSKSRKKDDVDATTSGSGPIYRIPRGLSSNDSTSSRIESHLEKITRTELELRGMRRSISSRSSFLRKGESSSFVSYISSSSPLSLLLHFSDDIKLRVELAGRLKKVVVEVQKHGDYDEVSRVSISSLSSFRFAASTNSFTQLLHIFQAMNTFLDLFSTYKGHTSSLASAASAHTANESSDPAFQRSWDQLKTILARSANGHSVDGITQAIDDIYAAAKEDELLRNWFGQVDEFVRKVSSALSASEACFPDQRLSSDIFYVL